MRQEPLSLRLNHYRQIPHSFFFMTKILIFFFFFFFYIQLGKSTMFGFAVVCTLNICKLNEKKKKMFGFAW